MHWRNFLTLFSNLIKRVCFACTFVLHFQVPSSVGTLKVIHANSQGSSNFQIKKKRYWLLISQHHLSYTVNYQIPAHRFTQNTTCSPHQTATNFPFSEPLQNNCFCTRCTRVFHSCTFRSRSNLLNVAVVWLTLTTYNNLNFSHLSLTYMYRVKFLSYFIHVFVYVNMTS